LSQAQSRLLSIHNLKKAMAPPKRPSSDGKTRSSSSISLKKVKGENFYRNAKQIGRLKMLSGGKAIRDKDGKIIQAAAFQKGEDETKPGRVQPDRRWFGMFTIALSITTSISFDVVKEILGLYLRKR
jgi:hypothetical protein